MGIGKDISDRELQKSINRKLMQRAGSDCKINAVVASGCVTLSGVLGQEHQRRALINSMQGIAGVKRVLDTMTVLPKRKQE